MTLSIRILYSGSHKLCWNFLAPCLPCQNNFLFHLDWQYDIDFAWLNLSKIQCQREKSILVQILEDILVWKGISSELGCVRVFLISIFLIYLSFHIYWLGWIYFTLHFVPFIIKTQHFTPQICWNTTLCTHKTY